MGVLVDAIPLTSKSAAIPFRRRQRGYWPARRLTSRRPPCLAHPQAAAPGCMADTVSPPSSYASPTGGQIRQRPGTYCPEKKRLPRSQPRKRPRPETLFTYTAIHQCGPSRRSSSRASEWASEVRSPDGPRLAGRRSLPCIRCATLKSACRYPF